MKKKIIISILILAFVFPLIISSIKTANDKIQKENSEMSTSNGVSVKTFIYGTTETPRVLDPIDCTYRRSSIVIDQVAETLFTYNYSDPSLPLIPLLATGFEFNQTDKLNLTIYLRQGVIFHDGSEFNSTVAKWNFDRIGYWWNTTGLLPANETQGDAYLLGYWEDGELPIFNRTEIVDNYTIKLVLNKNYTGGPNLLTHSTFAMLSKDSTPFFRKLTLGTDQIIGTGPFIFDYYDIDNETSFHAFENYWGGTANIDDMLFKYYSNQTSLNLAVLAKDIHFIENPLPEYIDVFEADPELLVVDDGMTDCTPRFLVFNNYTLNKTVRKALSYAINYTHITNVIQNGTSVQLKSPIPSGILYSNTTFNYP
ncbi:MAG: ABC transporter substrate-binding protein, partial [Promethearchaeota archaeon]